MGSGEDCTVGLPDIQNQADLRNIGIERVGITNVLFPIKIQKKDGTAVDVSARTRVFVGLPEQYKGVNMCYDDQTEVLTRSEGWLLFKDITYEHEVATKNIQTGVFEWQHPTRLYTDEYLGKLFMVETRSINLAVTPNHNLLLHKIGGEEQLLQAQDVFDKTCYKMSKKFEWVGKDLEQVILSSKWRGGYVKRKDLAFNTEDFMKLLGLYLAEGSATKLGSGYTVFWTNQDDIINQEVFDILTTAKLNPKIYGDEGTPKGVYCVSKTLHQFFEPLGKAVSRYIPTHIKDLKTEFLQILLTYYLKGDGSLGNNKNYMYITCSKQLAGDMQEVALKCGKSVNVKTYPNREGCGYGYSDPDGFHYVCYINDSLTPDFNYGEADGRAQWKEYDGLIYCCSVPNETLLVRRGGTCIWSGNSRFMESLVVFSKHTMSSDTMPALLDLLREKLKSEDAYARFEFDYYLDRAAPATGKVAPMSYRCAFTGIKRNGEYDFILEANVVAASLCPCSREMSLLGNINTATELRVDVDPEVESQLKASFGNVLGMGAHNQRSNIRAEVICDRSHGLWLEDLIDLVEAQASSPVYPILKRPDEKFVTEQAYNNAKFSEDITRDVQIAIESQDTITAWAIRVFNEESIHPYDVTCYQKSKNWKY